MPGGVVDGADVGDGGVGVGAASVECGVCGRRVVRSGSDGGEGGEVVGAEDVASAAWLRAVEVESGQGQGQT